MIGNCSSKDEHAEDSDILREAVYAHPVQEDGNGGVARENIIYEDGNLGRRKKVGAQGSEAHKITRSCTYCADINAPDAELAEGVTGKDDGWEDSSVGDRERKKLHRYGKSVQIGSSAIREFSTTAYQNRRPARSGRPSGCRGLSTGNPGASAVLEQKGEKVEIFRRKSTIILRRASINGFGFLKKDFLGNKKSISSIHLLHSGSRAVRNMRAECDITKKNTCEQIEKRASLQHESAVESVDADGEELFDDQVEKNLGMLSRYSRRQRKKTNAASCSVYAGVSKIHGIGIFAGEKIRAGVRIIEYLGEIIGNTMADKREKFYKDNKILSVYLFKISEDLIIDATLRGNMARFMNHSCHPNAKSRIVCNRIFIYSVKEIEEGEEITFYYNFSSDGEDNAKLPCNCGHRSCAKFIV